LKGDLDNEKLSNSVEMIDRFRDLIVYIMQNKFAKRKNDATKGEW
jgi:hypothetical protein